MPNTDPLGNACQRVQGAEGYSSPQTQPSRLGFNALSNRNGQRIETAQTGSIARHWMTRDPIARFMHETDAHLRRLKQTNQAALEKEIEEFVSDFSFGSSTLAQYFPVNVSDQTSALFRSDAHLRHAHMRNAKAAFSYFGLRCNKEGVVLVHKSITQNLDAPHIHNWLKLKEGSTERKMLRQMILSFNQLGNHKVANNLCVAVISQLTRFGLSTQAQRFEKLRTQLTPPLPVSSPVTGLRTYPKPPEAVGLGRPRTGSYLIPQDLFTILEALGPNHYQNQSFAKLRKLGDLPILPLNRPNYFPNVEKAMAQPDGLLAIGGELSTERLMAAYHQGVFPWGKAYVPNLWWSPTKRAVIEPSEFHASKRLRKYTRNYARKHEFKFTINQCFKEVITHCALNRGDDEESVWITADLRKAFMELHRLGFAHSAELWRDGELVAGLYGVGLGEVFCAESMFALEDNCSKIAFWHFARFFADKGGKLIDCQMLTPHLASLGAKEIPRQQYIQRLKDSKKAPLW